MATDDCVTGPMNLGNPAEFSMLELAHKVIALTASRSKLVHLPLPADDPRQRQPDISLARETIGWTPKITLDDGLKPTIAYFSELLRS
jgi:UDP-glucuronate decarboxylase